MKRLPHDQDHFSQLERIDEFIRSHGGDIRDAASQFAFIEEMSAALASHAANPMRVHGFRTQSMFAYIAGALGRCDLIAAEDSGLLMHARGNLRRPDFRILLKGGERMFVEVKNRNKDSVRWKRSYRDSLQEYADAWELPLYFAIYWSRWNLWTMTRSDCFDERGKGVEIDIGTALCRSEMGKFGDCAIGTVPPLVLRVIADRNHPRQISADGEVSLRIGSVSLFAGNSELLDEHEKRIAWFLMSFGKWNDSDGPVKVTDGEVDYFELSWSPEHKDADQDFAIVGYLSQLLSSQYLTMTTENRLSPSEDPSEMGVVIDQAYEGKDLRLWRFMQLPNYDGLSQGAAHSPH